MKLIYLINDFKYQKIIKVSFLLANIFIIVSCGSQNDLLKNSKPEDLESFKKFIWSRDTDSIIRINKKKLNYIYKTVKSGEDPYYGFLHNYSSELIYSNPIPKELSFEENAYVSAYLVEYLYKCQKKFKEGSLFKKTKWVNRFLMPRVANKYNREFKKHDYYGLKLLKKHHLKHYFQYIEEDTIPSKKRIIED